VTGRQNVDALFAGALARHGQVDVVVLTSGEPEDRTLDQLVPHQATFALLMVSALATTSRSFGWLAACRFRQAM